METPSSTVRRRAWIHSSRCRPTVEDPNAEGPSLDLPPVCEADDDDVFTGGKLESLSLSCGFDAGPEMSRHLDVESIPKTTSGLDDLRLGADASMLKVGRITSEVGVLLPPPAKLRQEKLATSRTPPQRLSLLALNVGHSSASSCPSSSFSSSSSSRKTTCSMSELLQLWGEDAEETLHSLGFGSDQAQAAARIPPRFFNFPSRARGINFRLFLESQLRRIREEDPNLSLASRFRQVEVLTAMANTFYSLYSHVSRTPLQKLSTPEFSFSSPLASPSMERFRSSARTEPRSPVERLKDTVSRMCLYTGSSHGSESTSPQPSPKRRTSVCDVASVVLDEVRMRWSEEECSGTDASMDRTQHRTTDADISQCGEQEGTKPSEPHSSNLEDTAASQHLDHDPTLANLTSKVTYDVICPQIVERIHNVPFCHWVEEAKHESSTTHCPTLPQCRTRAVAASDRTCSVSPCHITVTGWESGDSSSTSKPDSTHAAPAWTCEDLLGRGKGPYLDPQGNVSKHLQQVNSFELEEVYSAGEDDFGQTSTTSALSPKLQHKRQVARGDSAQSDSSGYADEEVGPSYDRYGR